MGNSNPRLVKQWCLFFSQSLTHGHSSLYIHLTVEVQAINTIYIRSGNESDIQMSSNAFFTMHSQCVCEHCEEKRVWMWDLCVRVMMWNTEEQETEMKKGKTNLGSAVLVWKMGTFSNKEWFIKMSWNSFACEKRQTPKHSPVLYREDGCRCRARRCARPLRWS